jgi:precorrin-2/cobalt-factor-2 C20-methyltransferase
MKAKGTLYGVGVGPGDPKLLTLRAVEVLGAVDVVFAAESSKNDYSLALSIAREHLRPGVEVVRLGFPMTRDPEILDQAWSENARTVGEALDRGLDAAFITLGDPLTYSTFGYLLKTILKQTPDTRVESIPGITAYHAAAARLNQPLAQGGEAVMIIPGINGGDRIKHLADGAENVVILKAYRNFDAICGALEDLHLETHAVLVSHCGLADESISREVTERRGSVPPYLSLLLVKKNGHA